MLLLNKQRDIWTHSKFICLYFGSYHYNSSS